jgi:hypothetical protein
MTRFVKFSDKACQDATANRCKFRRSRYIIVDGEVRILKARSVKELCGLLARPDQTPVMLESMDEAIVRGAAAGVNPELGS